MAAGDDIDAPHVVQFLLQPQWTWDELVQIVVEKSELPLIQGGIATWALSSYIPLAVVAQQWTQPEVLFRLDSDREALDWAGDQLRLHWSYFAQLDPNAVLETLRRLRLRAIDR